jgi:rhamnogalacturonan endolyase
LTKHSSRTRASIAITAITLALLAPTIVSNGTGVAAPAAQAAVAQAAVTPRPMEDLSRGLVAVRASETEVLVSWRLLGLDPAAIGFYVYRATGDDTPRRITDAPVTNSTNYMDAGADLSKDLTYYVRPVVNNKQGEYSEPFELTAGHAVEPAIRVPINAGGGVKYTWVGDLNGDGNYDYVIDRQTSPQSIEAYSSTGAFLWKINMGPNSTNQNNIEGGSSTIDVGNWDGVTVQDLDLDGRAEVALKVSKGVVFADGKVFAGADNVTQSMAVIDGLTGKLRASAPLPDDYISDGPLYARLGVGYLDGKTPSIVGFMKNRVGNNGFNLMISAWKFTGTSLTEQWTWHRETAGIDAPDGHNTRIIDVDGDGKDEIAEIGFVLNGDGTERYTLADDGVIHGDRFYIADIDPANPGLEGYGVQQDNPSKLHEYYYDAADGTMIWKHTGSAVADVGRGLVADIDPGDPGLEAWSFGGLFNASTNKLAEPNAALYPWPQFSLWWDGDVGSELLNEMKIEEWDPAKPRESGKVGRHQNLETYGAVNPTSNPRNPTFIGDIVGDWREEVVLTNATNSELIVFTTNKPTTTRLYTLAHNPAYRNGMTLKGYMQSHAVDYYLGFGMKMPAAPSITYVGQ